LFVCLYVITSNEFSPTNFRHNTCQLWRHCIRTRLSCDNGESMRPCWSVTYVLCDGWRLKIQIHFRWQSADWIHKKTKLCSLSFMTCRG
jgi:hypothetical protein